jgi:O-antigen ligase
MATVYALRRGGGRKAFAIFLALLGTLAAFAVVLAVTGSMDFLRERARLQTYDADRFAGQESGLDLVRRYPFGVGPGQFEAFVDISAHSTYVRTLAEQGVLGIVTVLSLFLLTLLLAARNAFVGRDTFGIASAALLGAWAGLLANSMFVDTLHWRHLWLVAALIWAGALRRSPATRPPGGSYA